MKFWKYHRGKLILGILAFAFLSGHVPYTKALYKSTFLLLELFPQSSVKPLGIFTKKPILKEVVYKSGDGEIFADLYSPDEKGNHPAAVLHLGLDIDRKDPRFQKTAEAMARLGIITLAPNIPSISVRRLKFETPTEFRDSYNFLISQSFVDQKKTGFFAFCAAGAPAIIASQSEDLKNNVDFILTINPYFDLPEFYKQITTRKINGKDWIPQAKTVEIFNRETIFLLEDEGERGKLADVLVSIESDKLSTGHYDSLSQSAILNLSEDGRNTYLGLINKDSEKAFVYQDKANNMQKRFLKELSASTYIENFKPKTFIFSEKPNRYIPYTHAEELHKNLSDSVFEEVNFTVTEPKSKVGAGDVFKTFKFIYQFILALE